MEWISVKDRLPETSGNYMVYGNCTNENSYSCDIATFDAMPNKLGGSFRKFNQPKYWMPLPQPPKGK